MACMDFYGPDMSCLTLRQAAREIYPPQATMHPGTAQASCENFEMYFQTGSRYVVAMRDAAKKLFQWTWDSLKIYQGLYASEDEEAEEEEVLEILGFDV